MASLFTFNHVPRGFHLTDCLGMEFAVAAGTDADLQAATLGNSVRQIVHDPFSAFVLGSIGSYEKSVPKG